MRWDKLLFGQYRGEQVGQIIFVGLWPEGEAAWTCVDRPLGIYDK